MKSIVIIAILMLFIFSGYTNNNDYFRQIFMNGVKCGVYATNHSDDSIGYCRELTND